MMRFIYQQWDGSEFQTQERLSQLLCLTAVITTATQVVSQKAGGCIPFPVARLIFSRHTALNQRAGKRYNANNDVSDTRVAAAHRRWRGARVFATFFGMHPRRAGRYCGVLQDRRQVL
jgi:hypothetical protein